MPNTAQKLVPASLEKLSDEALKNLLAENADIDAEADRIEAEQARRVKISKRAQLAAELQAKRDAEAAKVRHVADTESAAAAGIVLAAECEKCGAEMDRALQTVVTQLKATLEKIDEMGRCMQAINPTFEVTHYRDAVFEVVRQRLVDHGFANGWVQREDGRVHAIDIARQWTGKVKGAGKIAIRQIRNQYGFPPPVEA